MPDYFKILGFAVTTIAEKQNIAKAEIQAAYHRGIERLDYGNTDALKILNELFEAYSVLTNDEQRKKYFAELNKEEAERKVKEEAEKKAKAEAEAEKKAREEELKKAEKQYELDEAAQLLIYKNSLEVYHKANDNDAVYQLCNGLALLGEKAAKEAKASSASEDEVRQKYGEILVQYYVQNFTPQKYLHSERDAGKTVLLKISSLISRISQKNAEDHRRLGLVNLALAEVAKYQLVNPAIHYTNALGNFNQIATKNDSDYRAIADACYMLGKYRSAVEALNEVKAKNSEDLANIEKYTSLFDDEKVGEFKIKRRRF